MRRPWSSAYFDSTEVTDEWSTRLNSVFSTGRIYPLSEIANPE